MKKEKGVSIYMTVVILSILLSIGIGIIAILVGQTKMIKSMGDSVVAFYAADTGIERVLFEEPGYGVIVSDNLENGSGYSAKKIPNGVDNCVAQYYCIKSVGTYKEVRRAIEVSR